MMLAKGKHAAILGLLVGGVALGGSYTALASGGESAPPVSPTTPRQLQIADNVPLMAAMDSSVATQGPTSEVDAAAKAAFALLREAPSGMPADAARQVASPLAYGRNAKLARAITTPYGTGYVIPGKGYLCIAVPDPVDGFGTTCEATAKAAKQGLAIDLATSSKVARTVLAPDGAAVKLTSNGVSKAITPKAGVLSTLTDPSDSVAVELK